MTAGRRSLLGAALLTLLLASSCSPTYVLRAGIEEAKLLWRRQPIADLLARGDATPEVERRLRLVLRVREFAADRLGLSVGGSYSSVAEVGDRPLVFVVTAAERWRLAPYSWWFPIVGRVPYKGFFARKDADAEAARLHAEGYDTLVRGGGAFSTLGWFDDPLPSNLLRLDEVELATVLFHELLHNTRYFASNAAFAESFANFVGRRSAIAYFDAAGDAAAAATARAAWQEDLAYSEFLAEAIARLERAFAARPDEAERQALFQQARADLSGRQLPRHDWGERPVNNAFLLSERLYFDRLAQFDSRFTACAGDLRRTIVAILAATDGAPDPFAALAAGGSDCAGLQ